MASAERYRAAGVDLDAADQVKARIGKAVATTRTTLSRGVLGGFGGMVRIPPDITDPLAVLSTDGVGTKVLVAIRAGRHDTVGEDLVNHCVNDILVHGARPLAFQDYIAGAALDAETITALVDGVARGCRAHQMTLTGGETAQLADLYASGHYDVAGTILGIVPESEALHGDRVKPGDVLLGYASTGLHTNGYTLARRILFDDLALELDSTIPGLDTPLGEALLAIHRSYWPAVSPVLHRVHALAHITGGGIPGNLVRSLPSGCGARVQLGNWPVPALFRFLEKKGRVEPDEMYRVFNMGIGMIAIVAPNHVADVQDTARKASVETWVVGEVVSGNGVKLA